MTRTVAIAALKVQITINSKYQHCADMVVKQKVKLARWEAMSDAKFEVEQGKACAVSVHSMAQGVCK